MRFTIGSAAVVAFALVGILAGDAGRAVETRTPSRAMNAVLTLDNSPIPLTSMSGGAMRVDVVTETLRTTSVRSVRGTRYDPTTVQLAGELGPMVKWANDTWTAKPATRACRIASYDAAGAVTGERTFNDAILTELAFPALDGASREPLTLKAAIFAASVDVTVNSKGSTSPTAVPKNKVILTSNFRVTIEGLDASRVSRVDPIIIKTPAGESPRAAEAVAARGQADFGTIRLTVSDTNAEPWLAWFTQTAKGQNVRKTGSIALLTPDGKSEAMSLQLFDIIIAGVTLPGFGPGATGDVLIDLKPGRVELR